MTERHFRVVQLESKKVEFGGVSITSKASPGSAARKLLTSIAHEKGLKKNKKAAMPKVKFCIQEYTQGSSKKVYGPYIGYFHKYTAAELKKATTAKGKVKFTMKPVVKLAKGNMKGSGKYCYYQYRPQDIEPYIIECTNEELGDRIRYNYGENVDMNRLVVWKHANKNKFFVIHKDIHKNFILAHEKNNTDYLTCTPQSLGYTTPVKLK